MKHHKIANNQILSSISILFFLHRVAETAFSKTSQYVDAMHVHFNGAGDYVITGK